MMGWGDGWGHMVGWGGGFWPGGLFSILLMIAFWGLVIAGIVLLVRALSSGGRQSADRVSGYDPLTAGYVAPYPGAQPAAPASVSGARGEALRILDERYARGEVDRDDYVQRRADLLS